MAPQNRRRPYSGNQFIIGTALVLAGMVSFGHFKGSGKVEAIKANAGTSTQLYMLDPLMYGTPVPREWEINHHTIEIVRQARRLAREGRTEEIKRLIKQGLKIDKDLGRCQTLLMVACENGHQPLVRFSIGQHAR